MTKQTGTVIQVVGPVLDIRFADGCLPEIKANTRFIFTGIRLIYFQ